MYYREMGLNIFDS